MKPYSQPELRTFVQAAFARLEGSPLQEVITNDTGIALGFWRQRKFWLVIDLTVARPFVLLFEEDKSPLVKKPKPKPIELFVKAHAIGAMVQEFRVLEEYGRVVELRLINHHKDVRFVISLIPGNVNMTVETPEASISWEKPKPLEAAPAVTQFPPERSIEEIHAEWFAQRAGGVKPKTDPEVQWRERRDRDVEKKQKALEKMEASAREDGATDWYARGEEFKMGQGELIDSKKSRAWNIEEAFRKAKQAVSKREGTLERIAILKKEIAELQKQTFKPSREAMATPGSDLFNRTEAKGRRMDLGDGLIAYVGRSAKDNLELLRKARAWDLWLHLRDYPGAHAIISRNRGQNVGDAALEQAAQWLLKEFMKNKSSSETKLAVAIVECRFVRPIKGDRLGRVTYHNARHMDVKLR